MKHVLLVLVLVGLTACRRDVNLNVDVDTSATEGPGPATPAPGVPGPLPSSEAPSEEPEDVLNVGGFGAVRVGMTAAEAEAALGPIVPGQAMEGSSCRHLNPTGDPVGVAYMVNEGTVARTDVSTLDYTETIPADRLPRTAAGVGVGSKQAEVADAYGARMRIDPHEYVPGGRYLVVTPTADTTRRIIFETDEAGTVTSIRAGRMPEVSWVEGCS